MSAWRVALFAVAGYVAAITAIRIGVIRPLRQMVRRFEELLDLPDAVRDLTTTILRYIGENERRITRIEEALSYVARILRIRLDLGPKEGDGGDEPTAPT